MGERIDDLNTSYQTVTDDKCSLKVLTSLVQIKDEDLFELVELFDVWVKIFTN